MKRATTPRRRLAVVTALLTIGTCGVMIGVAARGAELERLAGLPAPAGVIIGGSVDVSVISEQQHGDPSGLPFATVSGAYRLSGFPYPASERRASVLFTRAGCSPVHRVVERPQGQVSPRLGKVALRALPRGQGCVAGLLTERDEQGIRRYVSGSFAITPAGGAAKDAVTVITRGQGFFRRALEPGHYVVEDLETGDVQSIEITTGATTLARFDRDPVGPTSQKAEDHS